jgi:hypothetical protein
MVRKKMSKALFATCSLDARSASWRNVCRMPSLTSSRATSGQARSFANILDSLVLPAPGRPLTTISNGLPLGSDRFGAPCVCSTISPSPSLSFRDSLILAVFSLVVALLQVGGCITHQPVQRVGA